MLLFWLVQCWVFHANANARTCFSFDARAATGWASSATTSFPLLLSVSGQPNATNTFNASPLEDSDWSLLQNAQLWWIVYSWSLYWYCCFDINVCISDSSRRSAYLYCTGIKMWFGGNGNGYGRGSCKTDLMGIWKEEDNDFRVYTNGCPAAFHVEWRCHYTLVICLSLINRRRDVKIIIHISSLTSATDEMHDRDIVFFSIALYSTSFLTWTRLVWVVVDMRFTSFGCSRSPIWFSAIVLFCVTHLTECRFLKITKYSYYI